MRICIVAEHASYRFGGEAALPLHYFRVLRARGLDARLLVHERTRAELEALLPQERERMYFIADSRLHRALDRAGAFLPGRAALVTTGLLLQLLTQWRQRRLLRKWIADGAVDVVHQPISVAPTFPSLLAGLGAPVVIGPLNGGMEYPPAFRGSRGRLGRIAVRVARMLSKPANFFLRGKREAAAVLVANRRTRAALPTTRGAVVEIPENGVDLRVWRSDGDAEPPADGRFVFVGRLVDWKALDIAIEALVALPGATLEVIGDGPMREDWRILAARRGLASRVRFAGWLAQAECARRMRGSVALLLPSLFECGGAVVLEAMALGLPVIATNWGGPADYLDASCGFLVDPAGKAEMIAGFAAAMRALKDSPGLRRRLGEAGKRRAVADYDWERKVDAMLRIYATAMENRAGGRSD